MRRAGYDVRLAPRTEADDGLFAASPADVAADLHSLLADPEVDLVVCTSGGYGANRVLDHLDYELIGDARKPIVGYSDVTAILWGVLARSGLTTFHGPMVVSEWGEFGGPWSVTSSTFRHVVGRAAGERVELTAPGRWTGEYLHWDREDTRPRVPSEGWWRAVQPGSARGWLLPGCTPTAGDLIGTSYFPDPTGAILCLESPDGRPDQLAAQLVRWRQCGVLDRIVALVLGRSPNGSHFPQHVVDEIVREVLGRPEIPVVADVDFGHTEPRLTLPVGGAATVDADALSLTLEPEDETRRADNGTPH